MNPREILAEIEKVDQSMIWHMPPIDILVNKNDAIAVNLINYLEQLIPNGTVGTYLDVLLDAQFYITLFATMYSVQKKKGEP